MMNEIIQLAHSGFAYIAGFLLIVAVINALIGVVAKKEYQETDKKIGLFALGAIHTQAVLGIIVYLVSPLGLSGFSMSNSDLRLTSMEHPFINLIAIVLMTIGWVQHKKLTASEAKFKKVALFYGIGLLLILSRIPWKLWF